MTPRPNDLVVRKWGALFMGRRFPVSVGRGGIGLKAGEGDGVTPLGAWRLTGAAWRADRRRRPDFGGAIFALGPTDRWCDDPASPLYNTHFRGRDAAPGHERLRRADRLYDLVLFSDWNTGPVVAGAGSAIFVHCWRAPRRATEGCVAFAPRDLDWIAARWRPWSRVVVQP